MPGTRHAKLSTPLHYGLTGSLNWPLNSNHGNHMTIWVDADACPVPIKQMLFRAADRVGVEVVLVANHAMAVPRSRRVRFMQVAAGFDVADNAIVEAAEAGDLVISADIELAAEALAKGAAVIGPRGEVFSSESIRSRQVQREFMQT